MRENFGLGKFIRALWMIGAALTCLNVPAELGPHDYSVELTATVADNPPEITLSWQADANARYYSISKKVLGEPSWIFLMNTRGGEVLTWTDRAALPGVAYEYQIIKNTDLGYSGYGYICAAIGRAPVENRGRMILLVEETLGRTLTNEFQRLQQDLVGDGWTVVRHDVSKQMPVTDVKRLIATDWAADPAGTKALFLFGHIAVPYSGNIAPDQHPDHKGAWPADVYYGEFDGVWTDITVSTESLNSNLPGDGKFDQDRPPGPVRLQIGRVDLSNLTCFANKTPARYELDLTRQYLNKDHSWRHAQMPVQRRGMVFDRNYRGLEPESQSCTAWRNFPGFFGRDQIRVIGQFEYFAILNNDSYLWSSVVSGGSTYGCDYVGTSDAWALNEPKVVFTAFLGSYFGDWDRESNFLRAPLGTSGYTLASIYAGQPQWLLHTMTMGETIGQATLLTQNNSPGGLYPPQLNAGAGEVHIALMGDPSLRMHPVAPPSQVTGTADATGAHLTWQASADPEVVGYYVYKSRSHDGPFSRVSGAAHVTTLAFTEPEGTPDDYFMVRALKLERTPSGTYFNLSQGAFFPDAPSSNERLPVPTGLAISTIFQGGVRVDWLLGSGSARGFQIDRRDLPNGTFTRIGDAPSNASSYTDGTVSSGSYAYRVKALGSVADSDFSAEATINLHPPTAVVAGMDTTTRGNWIGNYGQDGYVVFAAATNYPSYVRVGSSNAFEYVASWDTRDNPETLQYPDGQSRLMAVCICGHGSQLFFNFQFTDSAVHRVSFYMLDDDDARRAGTVEVLDPFTGATNATVRYSNYTNGLYLSLDLQNYAEVRITPDHAYMPAAISGIFFSTPTLQPPVITPGSGTFPGMTTVSIASTPRATIRYTTDGTEPGANAYVYEGPFTLRTNAELVAKAVLAGYADSATTRVSLTNSIESMVSFSVIDESTSGDWRSKYGSLGQVVPAFASNVPVDAAISVSQNRAWTWDGETADPRAIRRYLNGAGGIASCWYNNTDCVMDVSIYSDRPRQVAFYFVDWDRSGRVVDVTVTGASGQTVVEKRLENYAMGKYLVLNAKGTFRITVTKRAGPNATISGVFFGRTADMNQMPPQLAGDAAAGSYTLKLAGEPGQVFDIETSPDFRAWTVIGRRTLSGNTAEIPIPLPTQGFGFFRAVLVP